MDILRPDSLPEFLDPLLDSLPDPLYTLAVTLLSNLIAFLAATYNLASSVISTDASKWDAQKILPPIITLLAAYLALLSLYRTTMWAVRSTFFFVKWGGIIALVLASTGYLLGTNSLNNYVNTGTLSTAGNVLWNYLTQPNAPNSRGRTQTPPPQAGGRPSVWDSFDKHSDWRDRMNSQRQTHSQSNDIVQDIMDIASKYIGSAGMGGVFNAVMDALDKPQEDSRDSRDGSRRQSSSKAKSHSR